MNSFRCLAGRLLSLTILLLLAACRGGGQILPTATPTIAPPADLPTAVSAETAAPAATDAPATAQLPLILDTLLNASFPVEGPADGVAELRNGEYTEPIPDSAAQVYVRLLPETAVFGDLDGDGVEDAAVVLVVGTGGTGSFYHLFAVRNQGGQAQPVDAVFLGDRAIINGVRIDGGQIVVDFITQDADDPLCCPTLSTTQTYLLQGDQLALVSRVDATATPPPPTPVTFNPARITFAAGATSAAVEGTVAAGATADYVLRALGGQTMMVGLSSGQDVSLIVRGLETGVTLLGANAGAQSWSGVLPATQDYAVQVAGPSSGSAAFSLNVTIPQRIEFAPGATSAVVDGRVAAGGVNDYLLRAGRGQLMTVNLYSPGDNVFLSIYGLSDGQVLVRSALGQTRWTGTLPANQDYGIKAVSAGPAADYTLQIIIPQRIQFAPGAVSDRVQGAVGPQETDDYVLRASGGQVMTVTISSPADDVLLTIYGLDDGMPLVRYVSGATSWSGTLPGTQDYIIQAFGGGPAQRRYVMDVTVVNP